MKILDIIHSLDPKQGGPQHTVRTMIPIWRSMGHQADVLTFDSPDAPWIEPNMPNYAIGRLGSPQARSRLPQKLDRFGYHPGAIARLRKIVQGYDAVIVHGLWNFSTLAARLALVGSGVPYFVFLHGMLDPWHKEAYPLKDRIKQVIWPFNEGALLRHARGVLFTTQVEIEVSHRRYLPYRLNPIMVGYGCGGPDGDRDADIAALHQAFPQLKGRRFLLFLSRIHPKKGCDTLLDAFAQARSAFGDIDLVMAGPDQNDWRAQLEAQAARLGIADHVHWTGMIGGAVKWGAYRAADAFVLPSHGENFGIVVAEALACGTPVIISDRVNLYHAVLNHDAGVVVPHDLPSTVGALHRFAALSPDDRAAMSNRAVACFETNFRIETAARRIIDTVGAIVNDPFPPAENLQIAQATRARMGVSA